MMKNIIAFFILLEIIPFTGLLAQKNVTLSGFTKDAGTGEVLIGATIYVDELQSATTSNIYGFYSLTIPPGNYTIQISYMGYVQDTRAVKLESNKILNVELKEKINELQEVIVLSKAADDNVKSNKMGTIELDVKKSRMVPVVFGEQDILKTLQLSPGIKPASEGSSGYYVRGGTTDQNLILLDEATVYNSSHLLGFFSVFNSDAIKNAEMIKGAMPANYGGRISSVLDVKMNEGNSKKYSVSGGLGIIASRLTIEGPIVKDSASFIISGRRSYADMFMFLAPEEGMKNIGLYFYDFNMKANYIVNQNNRLYVSGYFGRDIFDFNNRFGFNWGNKTATIRWNHLFSNKLFLNSSFIYSDYNYAVGIEFGTTRLDIASSIRDYNLKEDFQYFINPDNSLKWGFNTIHHTFFPGEMSYGDKQMTNQIVIEKRYALENGIYLLNDLKFKKLNINYGIRYSFFNILGPGNYYDFDENGEINNTATYKNGKLVKTYHGLEPRVTLSYLLSKESSVKVGYAKNYQYLHLLSKSTSTSPTDLWIPSSNIVKPQDAHQFSAGYFRNLNNNVIQFSTEIYYKSMNNLIDYKNGADLSLNALVESQLIFGTGRAYGAEFSLEKKDGKLTGSLSYTLSKTERNFDPVNNGTWFPAKQDRTHDLNITVVYKFTNRFLVSATWVFYTGDAVTFPSGKYKVDGITVNYFTERNGERMPDYHRMDAGITWYGKKKSKYESSWSISLYNVYARKNAYSISFRENAINPMETEAVRLSLFSIVPSITYNFKF
jgi:hypothetical protein